MKRRSLGASDIQVTPVALGCWPIAGMTSLDVNDQDSLKTIRAAIDSGINFLDTAYCYGVNGESERLIATVISGSVRDQVVIATKAGIQWDSSGNRVIDGRPETILRHCDESLRRLNTDRVDLLYLHAPDPNLDIRASAEAFHNILQSGKAAAIGASNVSVEQMEAFQTVCPLTAVQPHYNMLQREIESELVPWCGQNNISIVVYWPLLKGLLAGKLARDHKFAAGDGRAKYPMFQGSEWQKNQDLVDELRQIAADLNRTVAQLVVAWTISQTGITSALCGAKRDYQIIESAAAGDFELDEDTKKRVDQALERRGQPVTKAAV